MVPIERAVDLIILMTSPTEMVEISTRLEERGFTLGDEVVEANAGIRSRLLPIAGGGFLEVASELSPGSFAHGAGFGVTPRLVSVWYTTLDAAGDVERWRALPGGERSTAGCGSWTRADGSSGYFIGIAPSPPVGDVFRDLFFGLRDRRLFPPPYLDRAETAPAVRRVTVRGPEAGAWRRQHVDFFSLPGDERALRAGATELVFDTGGSGATELTETFAVPEPGPDMSFAAGRFEFVKEVTT